MTDELAHKYVHDERYNNDIVKIFPSVLVREQTENDGNTQKTMMSF